MEFLTNSLKEVVSKLSENQREEVDVIESIVNINEENKENTKEKVFRFSEKRKPENDVKFIVRCIDHAAYIRPKERESLFSLISSVFNDFHLDFEIIKMCIFLKNMYQVKNILPYDRITNKHIFDFAEEGTIGRAIFDDNLELFQQLLADNSDEGKNQVFDIELFSPFNFYFNRKEVNRMELAALFGSIKCFKYLMINGDEINEETCKFAVAGGNFEIIHLCEQKGLQFRDCLYFSSLYHRFEIFEWLNTHFNYRKIHLYQFIEYYNEPLFYLYSFSGSNAETNNRYGKIPVNFASYNGHLEVVKYLYETCHADVEAKDGSGDTPIKIASSHGRLDVVDYLRKVCNANTKEIKKH